MTKKITVIIFIITTNIINAQISDFKNINFTKADNIASLHEGEKLNNIPLLCYNLTHKLKTDVEKFRAIYTWVSNNIKVDYPQYNLVMHKKNKHKTDSVSFKEWSNTHNQKFLKKLFKQQKTICTGYAYLLKKMAKISGIECVIVNGYGKTVNINLNNLGTVNHSWNAVKLNNKWYLCDATWSSGHVSNGKFINNYIDGFFLTDPKIFAKNHFPSNKKWLLINSFSEENFLTAPLLYNEAFKYNINPITPSTMKVKAKRKEEVLFEFNIKKHVKTEDVSLVHFIDNDIKKHTIYDVSTKDNNIKFKHKFKHSGIYDIHLKIKNDIVASYSVKVFK